jgi:hypothetical protein
MNIRKDRDDEVDAHEWQTQERAFREERQGSAPRDSDEEVAKYRLIARALRHPLPDSLPPDFASRTAAQVAAPVGVAGERFEIWLERVSFAFLAVTGAASLAIFGREWVAHLASHVSASEQPGSSAAVGWLMVGAFCIGISFAIEQWWRKLTAE